MMRADLQFVFARELEQPTFSLMMALMKLKHTFFMKILWIVVFYETI